MKNTGKKATLVLSGLPFLVDTLVILPGALLELSSDAILTAIQWQFYDSPTKAAIVAMGMG